jgi:hypothetical protein
MRIMDYQTGKELRDVSLTLTSDELEEITLYLARLKENGGVTHACLSQLNGARFDKELTIAVEGRSAIAY